MPLQFADIVNAKAYGECAVPGFAERLKFAYRPNALTPRMVAEFDTAKEGGEKTAAFIEYFRKFISWWDIEVPELDANGQPTDKTVNLPITDDAIQNTGFFLLKAVMDAAIEGATPGEAPSAS